MSSGGMSRNEKGQMKLFSLCSGSLTKGGLFTSGPMHLPMVIALKRRDGGGRFFPSEGKGLSHTGCDTAAAACKNFK